MVFLHYGFFIQDFGHCLFYICFGISFFTDIFCDCTLTSDNICYTNV